jgi:type II secretion system protein H
MRKGMTLLEILVVIAIIAIAASIAVVAYDGDDRTAVAYEAKRFAGAIEHASARARWRAETLGVSADGGGWQFWRRAADANRWIPVAGDDVLGPHRLPAGIVVSPLSYAGQALPPDAIVPLRASGHNDPFAFFVQGKASRIVLAADPLNRVTMQVQTESPP